MTALDHINSVPDSPAEGPPPPAARRHGPALQTFLAWQTQWQSRPPRERQVVQWAATLLAAAALWLLLLAPAWRTLQRAGAEHARLDAQWAEMQALAQEVTPLRAVPAVSATQAQAALQAAVARLQGKAQLTLQGPRAVVTLQGLALAELGPWLRELGSTARTRTLELRLTRDAAGYSGSMVLALPGAAP